MRIWTYGIINYYCTIDYIRTHARTFSIIVITSRFTERYCLLGFIFLIYIYLRKQYHWLYLLNTYLFAEAVVSDDIRSYAEKRNQRRQQLRNSNHTHNRYSSKLTKTNSSRIALQRCSPIDYSRYCISN